MWLPAVSDSDGKTPRSEECLYPMLDALTTIGGAGIYSTSLVKDYKVMPETAIRLRSNDYGFGMQTNSGSRVDQ